MNPNTKDEELISLREELREVGNIVKTSAKESLRMHQEGKKTFVDGVTVIAESVDTYRSTLSPSVIAVAGEFREAAKDNKEAATINAKAIADLVSHQQTQNDIHRDELREERKRQDARDERYFKAIEGMSQEVKEFSRISLDNAHQLSTLTDAIQKQCERTSTITDDLKKVELKQAEQGATAKAKWGAFHVIGVLLGAAICSGIITFILNVLSKPTGG